MQNPAFWARLGLLWCAFIFIACWCASAKAATPEDPGAGVVRGGFATVAVTAAPAGWATAPPGSRDRTLFAVANSRSSHAAPVASGDITAHAIPALNGFGLFVLATLLGVAALWLWRRRQ